MGFDEVDRDWAPPLGVIVGARISSEQHREYGVYATFKNGCAVTALWRILTHATGWVERSSFALFYCFNLLGESLGLHRYLTHAAFKTSPPMGYLLAILAQSGGYGSAPRWIAEHRRHHTPIPRSASNTVRWWEFDLTYALICLLEMLGLVWDGQRMPRHDGQADRLMPFALTSRR
jgi:fatty-acid desaturase